MFLVFFYPQQSIIKSILSFFEDNSVLVGVVTSMVVSSLWLRKFLKQKRAEAFFGFYARLSLCLKSLQKRLEENGRLNTSDPDKGNIFSLIYTKDHLSIVCPGFKALTDKELTSYKTAAMELKKILLETDNNVYPLGAERKEWYECQHIIFSFCEFLENDECYHITNESTFEDESDSKHIVKCKALVKSMNYIQESIEQAKY